MMLLHWRKSGMPAVECSNAQALRAIVLPWQPYRTAQEQWADKHNIKDSFSRCFRIATMVIKGLFVDNMHPSRQGHTVINKL